MDSKASLLLLRAGNEIRTGIVLINLSEKDNEKISLGATKEDTFYSAVISHSYYAIFYAARAILLTKGIEPKAPEIHKKTLEAFKVNLVETGILDFELLKIYNKMVLRADDLLALFQLEKQKRGDFTYKMISSANVEPAQESIENASVFIRNIREVMEQQR